MFSQKGMSGHCQNLSHRHDDGQATDTWCPELTRQITQRCEYLQIHSQKWKEFQCMMIRFKTENISNFNYCNNEVHVLHDFNNILTI